MKHFMLSLSILITNSLILSASSQDYSPYLEKTIAHHAKKDIKIHTNTEKTSHLGFGNCNFLKNGENIVVATFIKQDDIVVDAGAHIGDWTSAALKAAGNHCFIYAFEPIPNSYQSLKRVEDKFKNNILAFNLALGNHDATLEMNYFFQRGSGCSTLFHRPELHDVPVKKVSVTMTYLDKFAQEQNINHINFLKIDTEGCEFAVLQGAENLLRNDQIDIIQFEYGGTYPDANITLAEVYNYLTSYRYLIFRIIPQGLIYVPQWDPSLENFKYSNYLALKIIDI